MSVASCSKVWKVPNKNLLFNPILFSLDVHEVMQPSAMQPTWLAYGVKLLFDEIFSALHHATLLTHCYISLRAKCFVLGYSAYFKFQDSPNWDPLLPLCASMDSKALARTTDGRLLAFWPLVRRLLIGQLSIGKQTEIFESFQISNVNMFWFPQSSTTLDGIYLKNQDICIGHLRLQAFFLTLWHFRGQKTYRWIKKNNQQITK